MKAEQQDWDEIVGLDDEPPYEAEPLDMPADETIALDRANWHLRHIDRIRDRRVGLVTNFEAEMRRLKMRLDARLATLEQEEAWHTIPLNNLHRAILLRDDKRKTIGLAAGTLVARAQQAEWKYGHEEKNGELDQPRFVEETDTFTEWAMEEHAELIAPRVVGIKVPASAVTAVLERLAQIDDLPAEALVVSPVEPDKKAVKAALVKKDDKGKKVVAYGVDPATDEIPPGLVVTEREPKFTIDTSIEDVPDAEIVDESEVPS